MVLRAMWFSSVTGVMGAIMWRILTKQLTGIDLRVLAVAFMFTGAVGLSVSSGIFLASLRQRHLRNAAVIGSPDMGPSDGLTVSTILTITRQPIQSDGIRANASAWPDPSQPLVSSS